MPLETRVMIPLQPLSELIPHEQQFFPRMPEHETIEQTQVGKLLPFIARHLSYHRALPVDHFIVREGQDKVLTERVHQAERDLVMLVAAKNRVGGHIVQHIVHPSHVPFQTKTQAAEISGSGNLRPSSGFFSDHHHVWKGLVDVLVESSEEMDGFKVFLPTIPIGNPVAVPPSVV